MRVNRLPYLLLIAVFLHSALVADGAVGPGTSESAASAPSTVSGGGGGGSRLPDVETFIRQVEYWKTNYKGRFEYLQSLLYKPNFTTTKYVPPAVWLYYPSKNRTISRYDKVVVGALVSDSRNPIEIRRVLYLTLEEQDPGETSFKPAKAATQIIQVNDYDDTQKTCLRNFTELGSFGYLKQVGDVKLRIYATDGQYRYYSDIQSDDPANGYYHELLLKVYNIPPQINNTTMKVSPDIATWDNYILYTASFEDIIGKAKDRVLPSGKDENAVSVTLHIYNNSSEFFNITKPFQLGDIVTFSSKDASIFSEKDAGKNFTYRYSCTDGIKGGNNTTWSRVGDGPNFRPNPMIKVSDPKAGCEDENYYWWQRYDFSLKAKSLSAEPVDLKVDLYTDTPEHRGKFIASMPVRVPANDSIDVSFKSMQPFDVGDVNQTFGYFFRYSAPDQDGRRQSDTMMGSKPINARLIGYDIVSLPGLGNIAALLLVALFVSMYMERRFNR